jgi:hypothetical protein
MFKMIYTSLSNSLFALSARDAYSYRCVQMFSVLQGGIRTNTTVCLGKIACHLNPQVNELDNL